MSDYYPKNFVLTPADLGRVEHCPASAVYTCKRERPSFPQWHGIGMHKFLEHAKTNGRDVALKYIKKKFPRMYASCASIDVDSIPDGDSEIQFLIDTGRRTAFVGDYMDAEPDEHFYGRADLCYVDAAAEHHVVDYKTGTAEGVQPGTSWQIRTLATGLWLTQGKPERVHGHIVVVPALAWRDHTFQAAELEEHVSHMRRVHLQVLEHRAELRDEKIAPAFVPSEPGGYCMYCDIVRFCPAAPPPPPKPPRASKKR